MANSLIILPPVKSKRREKKGNKHFTNTRRRDRKARHGNGGIGGRCGSSFCSSKTGCHPWK